VTGNEQKKPGDEERPPRTAAEEVLKELRDAEPREAESAEDDAGEAGDATSPNPDAQRQSRKD
jgi:hypothetical protein